jgi:hypothetical protein
MMLGTVVLTASGRNGLLQVKTEHIDIAKRRQPVYAYRGTALIDGEWRDHVLTALTTKEWSAGR